jgi:hypothetical protein
MVHSASSANKNQLAFQAPCLSAGERLLSRTAAGSDMHHLWSRRLSVPCLRRGPQTATSGE